VLVAGGTGALGAAVLGELLESGYPVTATWVVPEERERVEEDFGGHDRLTLVEADVMREQAVLEALMSVGHLGAILHLGLLLDEQHLVTRRVQVVGDERPDVPGTRNRNAHQCSGPCSRRLRRASTVCTSETNMSTSPS